MKRINLLIVAIFAAICSFGQNTPRSNGENSTAPLTENAQTVNNISQLPALASLATVRQTVPENLKQQNESEYAQDKCASYRKMKIAGIVLASVGGGLIITGSILDGAARTQYYNDNGPGPNYYAMINGGDAMIGLGIVGLATGIPLAVIGSVKGHRYCGGYYDRDRYRSYISTKGNGLSLNF